MSVPSKKIDPQVEELVRAITINYIHLSHEGYEMNTKMGIFATISADVVTCEEGIEYVECITRTPDGRHFSWTWENDLVDEESNHGPAEYCSDFLTEVRPVVVSEWVTGGPSETTRAFY